MATFLRKIRRRLIAENRIGKYIPYAIGEIILVVIGILIALQINNMNEASKTDKLEYEALQNLKTDFESNKTALQEIIQKNTKNIESSIKILEHTGDKYNGKFLLDSLLIAAVSAPSYNAQNGFLNDLTNSGSLGILKNGQLRSKLSSWAPTLERLAIREKYQEGSEYNLIDFITKNGSWLHVDNYNLPNSSSSLAIPKSGFEVSNNDMLSSLEFENLVENNVIYFNSTLKVQNQCLKLIDDILTLIDTELAKGD
ncbi:DUF6090 family protein [Flagellimonas oceanensis]|uniref:DUF6090 family protein n=1 Tax=Flagellimonas oceanensis TaxID=2499163 RepID=UPI000F8E94F3|nr:DUF6090 family protein [Allomuricauda oceanensis]|tara:strand:- start:4665 stop:5429 length:765 start_codon:yes stop_codon:yes gene_type:complete